jgi:feruloyl-CoA synthase
MLRPAIIDAAAPLLQDAVIAGQDRDYITVLAWPNLKACCDKIEVSKGEPIAALLRFSMIIEYSRADTTR